MRITGWCLGGLAVLLLASCGEHGIAPDDDLCRCPAATLSLDSVTVLNGQTVTVGLRTALSYDAAGRMDSLGFLDLHVAYDNSVLSFLGAQPGPTIQQWEWFTYRHSFVDSIPGTAGVVNILAMRDLDNGPDVHPEGQHLPEGILAELHFYVTADRSHTGECASVRFAVLDCFDNYFVTPSADRVFVPDLEIGSIFIGPDHNTSDCHFLHGDDDATVEEVLALRSGKVCIEEPMDDRPLIGDLNLNGVAFEVADAVILANYLTNGESALDPDPFRRAWQIEAGDIDGDGVPLTEADYNEMVRIIEGGP